MRRVGLVWLQAVLIGLVFVGSLIALLFNVSAGLRLPREVEVRERLDEASREMADDAEEALDEGSAERRTELREVSREVLAEFPGVEGGFYIAGEPGTFAGYAHPTGLEGRDPAHRDEPPPLEAPHIRTQAEQSRDLPEDQSLSIVRDVGPSRVVIVTRPVGEVRPAALVVWTMYRLVGPRELRAELTRYRVSGILALGGLAGAVLMLLNLGRILHRQQVQQQHLRDDLRRAEHLAGLGKLLAGVAHEVRNPLAGIRSTVQLWQRLPATAQTEESRRAVLHAVDRLSELVTRLLYFARADSSERESVGLNDLLDEVLDLFAAQATGQGVTVERRFDTDMPAVSGSAGALRQVFVNLTANALQAMPAGGELHCETAFDRRRRTADITFRDTGPGVSPEVRPHLFEPFFTTRPDGTGLGLALCREIIAQHGGQIELADDDSPHGATFRVTLPVDP